MNAWLTWESGEWWHVAGWTMLHFLWLGAIAGIAAGVCRLVLRRASANVRYAAALVCLTVLAGLPVGIGVWVGAKPQAAGMAEKPVNVPLAEIAPAALGSAGGLTGALGEVRPAPATSIVSRELAITPSTVANPRQSRGLIDVFALVAGYLPWAWITGTPLTFVLLATGVVGAERLRRTSHVIHDGPIAEACARFVEALGIGRRVTIAVCERIAAPVLVGIVRPIILLPPTALTGWSPDEIEMVLLHELAHVRRWDNLVNLAQRFVEAALFFHPAVWLVSNWVRREREACCDAAVVGRTNRPHAYAEMLVALAAQMPRSVLFHPAATSAMAAGPLRGRIRRILGLQDDPMLISGKSLGTVMGSLLVVATLLMLYLPEQITAEEAKSVADRIADAKDVADAQVPEVTVMNQLKQLGLAMHMYHDAKGSLPAIANFDASGEPLLSWRVHILPYLNDDAVALYKEFRLDKAWDSEHNRKLIARMPAVFESSNGAGAGYTNLLAAVGYDCVFDGSSKGVKFREIADGVSNTVMLVEAKNAYEWTRPVDFKFNVAKPKDGLGRIRPSGCIAAIADGSVRLIESERSSDKVREMFTRGRKAKESAAGETESPTQPAIDTAGETLDSAAAELDVASDELIADKLQIGLTVVESDGDRFGSVRLDANRHSVLREVLLREIEDLQRAKRESEVLLKRVQADSVVVIRELESQLARFDTNVTTSQLQQATKESQIRVSVLQQQIAEINDRLEEKAEALLRTSEFPADLKLIDVPFVVGASRFENGDKIEILEVHGTAETFKPGNIYWIKGTYTLGSRDRAKLAAYTTVKDAAHGTSTSLSVQSTNVERGEGTFTLFLPMTYRGWPHVSFYPADGGEGFGGVYFGTGDSVLEEWWGPNEAIDTTGAANDSTSRRAKFPSLEEQKLADQAYRRLGLELEAIGAEDLKRVQALGYDGGVFVTQNNGTLFPTEQRGIRTNDILVGLHVWPTRSITEVLAVLDRDDLAELNPLKYYIVRSASETTGGFGPDKVTANDVVVTGRISIPPAIVPVPPPSMAPPPSPRYGDPASPVHQPAQPLPVPTIPNAVAPGGRIPEAQPSLYRIEVDPREIALDPNLQGPKPDRWLPPPALAAPAPDPLTEKEKQYLKAAGGVRIEFYYHPESDPCTKAAKLIPKYEKEYLGLVSVGRIDVAEHPEAAKEADIDRVPAFKLYLGDRPVLDRIGEMSVEQLDYALASIARHEAIESLYVPGDAASGDAGPPKLRYEGRTFGQWQMDFENSGSREAHALRALEAFAAAGYGPEAARTILGGAFSPASTIAKRSRKFLSTLPASEAEPIVAKLVDILETELSTNRRIDAIRALAAIGPAANSALGFLNERLASSDRRERITAAAAIKMIVGKDQYQKPVADVLGEELGIDVVESNGAWSAVPRKDATDDGKAFNDFTEAVIKEQQQLFPDGKF